MKEKKIYQNYGVFGNFNNELYLFYFDLNDIDNIKYKKIKKYILTNEINYQKYYIIQTYNNIIFNNIICNRRVYTSTCDFNILKNLATNIIKNSFGNYSML
jgi:hypothetical protein